MKPPEVFVAQNVKALIVVRPQDDSNVQANRKQKGQGHVGREEDDAKHWPATVPNYRQSGVLLVRVAVWRCVQNGIEKTVPPARDTDHKHTDHAVSKGLEVIHVVESGPLLHVGKVEHAENGKGDVEEEEDNHNVEEGRK